MRVPFSWLKEYIDVQMSPEALADLLTMAGLEVDAIDYIGKNWGDRVITAQIVHLEDVAGSDHLHFTRIQTGSEELGVICGAPNIRLGDKVPLALPGAKLGDLTIMETKKMGFLSQGMLCSPKELGMGNDHAGIYILDPQTPLGVPLNELFGEVVFEFSIKAHRGDLSSVLGIAREVSALTGQPLRWPDPHFQEQGSNIFESIQVKVEAPELCARYSGRLISDLKLAPSPDWMARRLLAAGMRPISNIVDITNYVMLETGQPLHAFDYDLVRDREIIVRRAKAGESIITLDEVKRPLKEDMLLITDPQGATGIAGVMGGMVSEVNDHTKTVFLESANFKAGNVRHTSVSLGLRTDASGRFEKGLDPELTRLGLERACQLLEELASGHVHPGVIDLYPNPVSEKTLLFSVDDVEWLTSLKVTQGEAESALNALGFRVVADDDGKQLQVTVPTYRRDVEERADLVEEVVRIIGYDKVPSRIPSGPLPSIRWDEWFEREETLRTLMAEAGLSEIITYTLTSRARMLKLLAKNDLSSVQYLLQAPIGRAPVQELSAEEKTGKAVATLDPKTMPSVVIVNPLNNELEALRLTLMSSLLETLQENSKRVRSGLRFFELGRRYLPQQSEDGLPDERRTLGFAIAGPAEISWHRELAQVADFYDARGIIENMLSALHITDYRFTPTQHPTFHPGRCALLELGYRLDAAEVQYHAIGLVGEVHPVVQQRYDIPHRVYVAEIDLERLYEGVPTRIQYQPISRHQELGRDLGLVVDQNVSSEDLRATIMREGGDLLRTVTLFDLYTGDPIPVGKKNLAYTLVYQAPDRTLTDAEVNTLQDRILAELSKQFGATLRQ